MTNTLICLALFTILHAGPTTQPVGLTPTDVFPTGQEQVIVERFVTKPATQPAGAFQNSLDDAFALLEAKVWPQPNRKTMAASAVRSLTAEFRRQTGQELASALDTDTLVRTGHFDPLLSQLDKATGRKLDRASLIQRGLAGLLAATGWDEACVLPKEQVAQLEAMMAARSQPADSGPAADNAVLADRPQAGLLRIAIASFESANIADKVEQEIKSVGSGLRAVILDLRDNPGGRPEEANAVADLFLDDKVLEVFTFRNGQRIAFKARPGALRVPLLVLNNRNTGSAAEMLAMALQDNGRATLIGERTAGALFGKDVAKLVGGETILFPTEPIVLSPKGQDYSKRGVPPDVAVQDKRRAGADPILNRAIQLADQPAAGSRPSGE